MNDIAVLVVISQSLSKLARAWNVTPTNIKPISRCSPLWNVNNNDNNGHQTVTTTDNKTVLQALALINDCNKYKMDLTTNGVMITDAIRFVQTNKEKLTMSAKEKETDHDDDKDQIEEKQEEE